MYHSAKRIEVPIDKRVPVSSRS